MTISEFLAKTEARKTALGMVCTPSEVEAMRNKGARRTPQKRELLRRAEARARAAGKSPVAAYY